MAGATTANQCDGIVDYWRTPGGSGPDPFLPRMKPAGVSSSSGPRPQRQRPQPQPADPCGLLLNTHAHADIVPGRNDMSDDAPGASTRATALTDRSERYGKQLVSHGPSQRWTEVARNTIGAIKLGSRESTVSAKDGELRLSRRRRRRSVPTGRRRRKTPRQVRGARRTDRQVGTRSGCLDSP